MNEKIECLKMAIEYERLYNDNAKKYHFPKGIVEVAEIFYEFVSRKEENEDEHENKARNDF